jgi:hypothetical protein
MVTLVRKPKIPEFEKTCAENQDSKPPNLHLQRLKNRSGK